VFENLDLGRSRNPATAGTRSISPLESHDRGICLIGQPVAVPPSKISNDVWPILQIPGLKIADRDPWNGGSLAKSRDNKIAIGQWIGETL